MLTDPVVGDLRAIDRRAGDLQQWIIDHERLSAELRQRLAASDTAVRTARAELDGLGPARAALLPNLRVTPAAPPPTPPGPAPSAPPPVQAATGAATPTAPEWRAATLGNVLLGLGTVLLTIAALVFASVTWQTLTEAQRALVLLGVTAICAAGAGVLHRRLPNTAEAFGVLFVAFALVDWYAIRRAGVASGLGEELWWSIGLAGAAGLSLGTWSVLRLRVQQHLTPVLAAASGVTLVAGVSDQFSEPLSVAALGVSLVSTLAVLVGALLWSVPTWRRLAATASWLAVPLFGAAAVLAVAGTTSSGGGLGASLAWFAVALAPIGARVAHPRCRSATTADALVAGAAATIGLGLLAGAAGPLDADGVAIVAAALVVSMALASRFAPAVLERGLTVVAAAGGVLLAIPASVVLAGALVASTSIWTQAWAGAAGEVSGTAATGAWGAHADPFTGAWWAAVVWAALGAAVAVAAVERHDRPARLAANDAASLAIAAGSAAALVLPVTAGWPVATAALVDLCAGGALLLWLVRRPAFDKVATAGAVGSTVLALAAISWAVYDPWLTVVCAAGVAVVAAAAFAAAVADAERGVLAGLVVAAGTSTAGLVVGAAGAPMPWAGATTVVAATAAVVLAAWVPRLAERRPAIDVAATAPAAVGLVSAAAGWPDAAPFATATAVAVVAVGLAASAPKARAVASRAAAVAGGFACGALALSLLTVAAGVDQIAVGLLLGVLGAVGLVASTVVLRSGRADLDVAQRVALAASAGTAGVAGVALAYLGEGLLATSGPTAAGWAAQPWWAIGALGALTVGSVVASMRAPEESLRAVLLAVASAGVTVEAGLLVAAVGGPPAWAATAVVAASAVVVVGSIWSHGRSERGGRTHRSVVAVSTIIGMSAAVASLDGWVTGSQRWATVASLALVATACSGVYVRLRDDPRAQLALGAAGLTAVLVAGLAVSAAGGSAPAAAAVAGSLASALVAVSPQLAWRATTGAPAATSALLPVGAVGWLGALAVAVGGEAVVSATPATTMSGWGSDPWVTVSLLGALALAALAAAATTRALDAAALRDALAGVAVAALLATVATAAAAAGVAPWVLGVTLVGAAGGVQAAGAHLLRGRRTGGVVEVVGAAGAVVGLAWAHTEPVGMAIALTTLSALLGVVAAAPGRRCLLWAAAGAALGAVWAWLGVADVEVPEAYALPAAAVSLAAGLVGHRRRPETSSWLLFGPALALGLAPTLLLALGGNAVMRPLVLSAASAGVTLVGVRFRLQAPVVVGGTVLVILAFDTLWPVASFVPRWVLFAAAGAAFVWLGATIERRIRQLRSWAHTVGELD